MLSISLRGLLEVKPYLQNAILNDNAVVKILILQPDSRFVKEREQQEGYELRRGQIAKECQATIDRAKELSFQIRSANEQLPPRVQQNQLAELKFGHTIRCHTVRAS
jgi:hypothetical protein